MQTLRRFFPAWANKRAEFGISLDAFLLISVGELNGNKNNSVILSAIEKLYQYPKLCQEMSRYSRQRIQNFDVSIVKEALRKIYERSMNEEKE